MAAAETAQSWHEIVLNTLKRNDAMAACAGLTGVAALNWIVSRTRPQTS